MIAGIAWSSIASAELKIVLLDYQQAIMNTDYAKKMSEKVSADVKPQQDQMSNIKKVIEGMDDDYKKNGSTMTEQEKINMQKKLEGKMREYQGLNEVVQKHVQEISGAVLKRMLPELDAVVVDIKKVNKYDIILNKGAALLADPSLDITQKVTEQLNIKMKNAK